MTETNWDGYRRSLLSLTAVATDTDQQLVANSTRAKEEINRVDAAREASTRQAKELASRAADIRAVASTQLARVQMDDLLAMAVGDPPSSGGHDAAGFLQQAERLISGLAAEVNAVANERREQERSAAALAAAEAARRQEERRASEERVRRMAKRRRIFLVTGAALALVLLALVLIMSLI